MDFKSIVGGLNSPLHKKAPECREEAGITRWMLKPLSLLGRVGLCPGSF